MDYQLKNAIRLDLKQLFHGINPCISKIESDARIERFLSDLETRLNDDARNKNRNNQSGNR